MKLTCVKSGFLFFFIVFLFPSSSVIPEWPADDMITNDWNTYIKAHSEIYCVSLNKFEILEKSKVKLEYDITISISGEWKCQNDTVKVSGPFNLFIKSKGKNQTYKVKMVYSKEDKDWIFKGFITR